MSESKYEFWVDLKGAGRVVWERLTEKQARDMYAYTDTHQPEEVNGYGWGLMSWGGDWK